MQAVLRNAEKDKLPIALKGASETMRDFFLKNMSERGGKLLKEEIAGLGPVSQSTRDEIISEFYQLALARSYGDLRENHEYKSAKEMQKILMRRKVELEVQLTRARGADFTKEIIVAHRLSDVHPDQFSADMETVLREIGVGDISIPKKMRRLAASSASPQATWARAWRSARRALAARAARGEISMPESASSAPQRRASGKREVREALVSSATDLFAHKGPKAVSIREITQHAGLQHGLIHRFDSTGKREWHHKTREAISSVAVSPNGEFIAAASDDNNIYFLVPVSHAPEPPSDLPPSTNNTWPVMKSDSGEARKATAQLTSRESP